MWLRDTCQRHEWGGASQLVTGLLEAAKYFRGGAAVHLTVSILLQVIRLNVVQRMVLEYSLYYI
jgi:hypothetical protein